MSRVTPSGPTPPGNSGSRPPGTPLAPPAPGAIGAPRPTIVPVTRIPGPGTPKPLNPAPGSNPNGKPASSGAIPLAPINKAPSTATAGGSSGIKPPAGAPPAGGSPVSASPTPGTHGMPALSELKARQLGRVLQKMHKVTREQTQEALSIQKQKGTGQLGRILLDLGYIKDADLNIALAAQQGLEHISLENITIDPATLAAVPAQLATTNKVLPLSYDQATKTLVVALASHENFRALDDLRSLMGYNVTAKIADSEQLERLIGKHYQAATEGMDEILGELSQDDSLKDLKNRGESIDIDSLNEAANSNPVKKLINLVLLQAIKDKASDVHFEPFEGEFKMRYRIDGVLYEMMPPPAHIAPAISSRIKVMANLDIAERRMPQDGRIELSVNNQPIDLRVSVLPTMFGESVVMRVLDRGNVSLDLDKLGMREEDLNAVRQLINKPNGICIVTGPTGSGKTTTLYSALRELNTASSKLITAEDPVEYDIDGIIQCQIKPDIELTFGRILRAMLRQDPDTIMVGEIRDKETAEISVQASLTGHLVFTTLHTNDAPSAIARLLDLGVEPFLVTATIEGIIAQRLVRKICNNCKTEYTPSEEQLMELELRPEMVTGKKFYYGKGCSTCNNTGYKGRFGLYEIMVLDDDMRDMIVQHASTQVLRVEAKKRGMRTLRQCGLLAIYDGISSIEEVVRETLNEEE
ncbi:MAG: Flp pilus assembly complex ATPase component TadA [Planctomycetota bacterium]|nr:Flp pilus assembly complex ATPase component TadA [Planctomycetota bacterium]